MRSSRSVNCNGCWVKNNGSANPQSGRGDSPVAKMVYPLTFVAAGRPVKLVSECLSVARSQLAVRIKQSASPKVRRSRLVKGAELVAESNNRSANCPTMAAVESGDCGIAPVKPGRYRRSMLSGFTGSCVITTCCLTAGSNNPACRVGTRAVFPCKPAIRAGARTALSSTL